ncbi:MAG: aldehyde dehydrogenase family protein [Planctomycetota bacterium]|nr:aldehyde dehydrogenase family protein [Planctomycetota bacterium]MDA1106029.1 aldehyde dehydrogenase family protein [Planctomycetota bacterium]
MLATQHAPMLTIRNPSTGEVVGEVPVTPVAEIAGVVARAREAQVGWAAKSLDERASIILRAKDPLAAAAERMGSLASREMGKPIKEALGEAKHAAGGLEEMVKESVEALREEVLEDASVRTRLVFDPYGVAAAITPWNFPILMPVQNVLPALIAGNAVIFKPSEVSPLCAQAWAKCLQSVLPEDVLQVIHGDGTQGSALIREGVDLVVFTGSRATGMAIMREASGHLTRLILELGGKDPLIVLEDADLEAAATFAVRNSFRNAGQVCVSTERIFVHDAVADRFTQLVVEGAKTMKQGDSADESTQLGPMASARQKSIVMKQLQEAIAAGAKCLVGEGDDGAAPSEGNFVRPTVLVDVTPEMSIMRDETFGPVAPIVRVSTDAQAVALANDTPYGLGAAVFGAPDHAARVADQLTAGMVGINKGCGGADGSPWVGSRHSGHGFHGGKYGTRQFAQVRTISRSKA